MGLDAGYIVYVLLSHKDKKFYIGFTRNLGRRLEQHKSGMSLSTKSRRPFKLLYYEYHLNKKDELRRESYFKSAAGKRTLNLVLRNTILNIRLGLL